MATPRTQVPELQFGVGYQPVASPALQAPVLRAPQVYPDDTVQALTEFANNFTQGFAKLKQVETQQDTILGEQMFLEQQAEFEGLFDSATPSLDSEGKFLRAKQLAEETSLGARIGFERAAGRMLASRERETIEQAIQKAAVEGSAPDPTTGIPGNPSLFNADSAIANARKGFRDSVAKSGSNWVLSSPYAQEEYTNNMARLLPEAIAKGRSELLKVKQEKFREQLMEQTSSLINNELSKVWTGEQTKQQAFANIGTFVRNNAVRGGISNPRQFLVQASFNAARMSLTGQVLSDGTMSIDTAKAQRLYDLMGEYTTDGASLTGGEVGELYYRQGRALQNELASLSKQQDPGDRLKISVDAFRTGKLTVAVDKDNNIVSRTEDGKPPAGGKIMPLREYLEERRRIGGLDAVNESLAIWQGKLNPKTDGSVYADGAGIAQAAKQDFSVSPDSPDDLYATSRFKDALIAGDFPKAQQYLGLIKGVQARGEANKLFDSYTSAESKMVLDDPTYKREFAPLEQPDAYIISELNKLGVADLISDSDKAVLFERARTARDNALVGVREALRLPPADRLRASIDAVKNIRSDIDRQVAALSAGPAELINNINNIQSGASGQPPRSAANEIIAAFNSGRISPATYQRLLTQDANKMEWQTALNKVDLADIAQKAVRTSALTNFAAAENPYLVTVGASGQRELSMIGVEAANAVSERVKTRLDEFIKANLPAIRGPGADKILENLARNYTLEEVKKDANLNSKTAIFGASRRGAMSGKQLTADGGRVAIVQGYAGIGTQYGLSGSPLSAGERLSKNDMAFARDQETAYGNPNSDASPFIMDQTGMPLDEAANIVIVKNKRLAQPREYSKKEEASLASLYESDSFRLMAPFQMNHTEAFASRFEAQNDPAIFHHQGLLWAQKVGFDNWGDLDNAANADAVKNARPWFEIGNRKRVQAEQDTVDVPLSATTQERILSSLRVHTGLSPAEWEAGAYIVKNKAGEEVKVPITDWGLLNFSMAPIIPPEILKDPTKAKEAWARVGITDAGMIGALSIKQRILTTRNETWGIR